MINYRIVSDGEDLTCGFKNQKQALRFIKGFICLRKTGSFLIYKGQTPIFRYEKVDFHKKGDQIISIDLTTRQLKNVAEVLF